MTNIYTVIGLRPDCDWSNGMREASFVARIKAMTPSHAGLLARRQIASENGYTEDDVEIFTVFEGCHEDLYTPSLAADAGYMAELDHELTT